jgi:glycosyltransferase involved in cell wall biosynthesis
LNLTTSIVLSIDKSCWKSFQGQLHLSESCYRDGILFTYWGRRGALSRFALEVGREALANSHYRAALSVSRDNADFQAIRDIGGNLVPVRLFSTNLGAITQSWRIPIVRRQLVSCIERQKIGTVVELMPHVWSPFIMPAMKASGVRYISIVHDADAHPGDRTGLVKSLLNRAVGNADLVLTLSGAVAGRLEAMERVDARKIFTLFHPDLHYGDPYETPRALSPNRPPKLLFLGRILHYKGLPIFIDAVEQLRSEGYEVEVGVFGEGALGRNTDRLKTLGAKVVNHWLSRGEIASALASYDIMVLSHVESSQSGVAATAFGAGMPVVCTPVGGLPEQVLDGVTGFVARRADGPALAESIKRLVSDPQLYQAMSKAIIDTRNQRSMARFVQDCVAHARYAHAS